MATWYKINASAKLTVRADSLNVRSGPQLYDFVKSVKAGEVVQATERALISGDPWFHISDGWISGKYVEGWVKDNNNNNSWWYVEKNYGPLAGRITALEKTLICLFTAILKQQMA